jgi:hypothetical protein
VIELVRDEDLAEEPVTSISTPLIYLLPSASCEYLYPLNLPFGRFPPPVALVQR